MPTPQSLPSPKCDSSKPWRCPTDKVRSSMPKWRSCLTMISRIGSPPTGTSGLGRFSVSGISRVPLPPARITARTPPASSDIVDLRLVARRIGADPFDRAPQPLFERHLRAPAEQIGRLARIGEQQPDLALAGADAVRIGDHLQLLAGDPPDLLDHVGDADGAARADIDHLAERRGMLGH